MKKIKEAQDNEKKQQREDQKSRYQEALPVTERVSTIAFEEPDPKVIYLRTLTPETVQRPYSILLPPKVA